MERVVLPKHVQRYFWGDDLGELDWQKHRRYIINTILEHGDLPAIRWLLRQVSRRELARWLPKMKLSPKSANFWRWYLLERA